MTPSHGWNLEIFLLSINSIDEWVLNVSGRWVANTENLILLGAQICSFKIRVSFVGISSCSKPFLEEEWGIRKKAFNLCLGYFTWRNSDVLLEYPRNTMFAALIRLLNTVEEWLNGHEGLRLFRPYDLFMTHWRFFKSPSQDCRDSFILVQEPLKHAGSLRCCKDRSSPHWSPLLMHCHLNVFSLRGIIALVYIPV